MAVSSAATPEFVSRRDYYFSTGVGVVADVDGNNIPDMIAPGTGTIAVLLGNGNGTFRTGAPSTGIDSYGALAAADLDGDGNIDVVIAGSTDKDGQPPYGVAVCIGNGNGTFQPPVFYPAGNDSYATYVVIGDFNNDGIPDVATIGSSGLWVFLGKGDGTLSPGMLTPFNTSSRVGITIAASDFNNDHKLDVVAPSTGGFAVLFGNGDGTFAPQYYTTPYPIGWVAAADLTNNGDQDVVTGPFDLSPFQVENVNIYLGNGAGAFSGPTPVALPGASEFAIADLGRQHLWHRNWVRGGWRGHGV